MVPELLCIGHVCHDETNEGFILGGTTAYCSLVASHLGYRTAVLTSYSKEFLFSSVFAENDIEVYCKPSAETTIFKNIYVDGHRTQYLKGRAEVLGKEDIPNEWANVSIVKFCLIANELKPDILTAFPNALKGATIQGWLRGWDEDGLIHPEEMDWSLLRALDVICMSKDDIKGFEERIPYIASCVDVLVLTDGRDDAVIYHGRIVHHFPSYHVEEVDPTGAGDVFAAAFLLRYSENKNIGEAVIFAHCAASLVVEGIGIEKLKDLDLIHSREIEYIKRFPHVK